jgi:uncharacterized protein YbcV (DUF1398 family)
MSTKASTSQAISNLQAALQRAMAGRPKVGGFPYLAETLRRAGVSRNLWHLRSCQSLYLTEAGPVVNQGTPLFTDTVYVPPFDQAALVRALRTDQAGASTFPQFFAAAWQAGVVSYEVDLTARAVAYHGVSRENYVEEYLSVGVI